MKPSSVLCSLLKTMDNRVFDYMETQYRKMQNIDDENKLHFIQSIIPTLQEKYHITADEIHTYKALDGWHKNKIVYTFDENIRKELCNCGEEITINRELIARLPHKNFFIEWENPILFDEDIKDIERSLGKGFMPLGVMVQVEKDLVVLTLIITAKDKERHLFYDMDLPLSKDTAKTHRAYACAWNMILYLCAENAVVRPSMAVHKKGKVHNHTVSAPKRENVCYFPPQCRKTHKGYATGTGKTKAAHERRAHWHNYWMGKKGEQRLVLKWVSETVIHGNKKDINLVKVR